jgi:hypothetical protein
MSSLSWKLATSIKRQRQAGKCPRCGSSAWVERVRSWDPAKGAETYVTIEVIRCRRTACSAKWPERCKPTIKEIPESNE